MPEFRLFEPRAIPRAVYFFFPAFLVECAMFMIILASPLYAIERFHAQAGMLGFMGALAWGGYAVAALAAGSLSDRTGRRPWMVVGLVSQVPLIPVLLVVPSMWGFAAVIGIQTTLLAFVWAPMQSFISETTTHHRLSRELRGFNVGWGGGNLAGAALFGWLSATEGLRAPFWAALVMFLVAAAILGFFQPVTHDHEHAAPRPPHPRAERFKYLAWLALFCNFLIINMILYIFPRIAIEPPLSLGETAIARLHAERTFAMLACFVAMGLTRRWHFRRWPLHVCFALMLTSVGLLIFIRAPGMLIVPFVAIGLTSGMSYWMSAYYSMLSLRRRGAMMGTHEMLLSSGSMIGPLLAGSVLSATGRPAAGYTATLLLLAVAWLAVVIFIRDRNRKKDNDFGVASEGR